MFNMSQILCSKLGPQCSESIGKSFWAVKGLKCFLQTRYQFNTMTKPFIFPCLFYALLEKICEIIWIVARKAWVFLAFVRTQSSQSRKMYMGKWHLPFACFLTHWQERISPFEPSPIRHWDIFAIMRGESKIITDSWDVNEWMAVANHTFKQHV